MNFNPGPFDPTLLYDQKNHVSEDIWNGIERGNLDCVHGSISSEWVLTEYQEQMLDAAGFQIFMFRDAILRIDTGLISALVERWRPETNSFHFREGETTITLEDVGYILGLPLIGKPIVTQKGGSYQKSRLMQYLDIGDASEIPKGVVEGGGVKFTYLVDRWGHCPEDADYHTAWIHTKAYILYCLGKVLFPNKTKNRIHTAYLEFLDSPDKCRSHAWGAAVLAYLYRGLYRASRRGAKFISGCLTLLQVWSYERIRVGRPLPRPGSDRHWLRAVAWEYGRDNSYNPRRTDPHHHGIWYRGELDILEGEGSIEWRPYERFFGSDDTGHISDFGHLRCALIHFDIAEYQLPDRVIRQFGPLPHIPPAPPGDIRTLRNFEQDSPFALMDPWKIIPDHIESWNSWQAGLDNVPFYDAVSPGFCDMKQYHAWYHQVTRIRIQPPQLQFTQEYTPRAVFDQKEALAIMSDFDLCVKRFLDMNLKDESRFLDMNLKDESTIAFACKCRERYGIFKEQVMGQPRESKQSLIPVTYPLETPSVGQEVVHSPDQSIQVDKGKRKRIDGSITPGAQITCAAKNHLLICLRKSKLLPKKAFQSIASL